MWNSDVLDGKTVFIIIFESLGDAAKALSPPSEALEVVVWCYLAPEWWKAKWH